MLPAANRLTDAYDFRRVRRVGRAYHHPFFVLTVAHQKEVGPSRFGFVISKKFDKRATVRNRTKRLLREAVKKHLEEVPEGFDLVFFVRPAIKGKSYAEVSSEVDKSLSEVSFTRPRSGKKAFSHR
jgi:ribonuclease P protein component